MPAIENLTGKIIKDSEAKAEEILAAAREKAEKQVADQTAEARRRSEKMLEDARREAALESEQIVQGRTLAIRDDSLDAKQQVLDRVFADAVKQLEQMPEEKFLSFLVEVLSKMDLEGEKITLPASCTVSIDKLNAALGKVGKGPLTSGGTSSRLKGGFILSKGGIEMNNSFETLVKYYRHELESDVLKLLY